ncbi:MAG: hypothetical protein Q8R82_16355 [Hyphomonadaceae bacterium]|nr:hypothetical protein [Hyphomonadaceae bacterium]
MSDPQILKSAGAELAIFREGPSLKGARTAALGRFACETPAAGAALIREAMAELKAEGFEAVLGPMDGSTWAKHRLVIESDGRAPFLMEPENPAHHVDAFQQSGLEIVSRYVSAVRPADVLDSVTAAPAGVSLRDFDPTRAEEELTRIHKLSLEAFASNHFYQPIVLEDFLASYRPVLKAIDPELVLLAEDQAGELKGFLFALPNLAEGPKPRSVILKTYASRVKGGGSMLANAFHERAKKRGFVDVIHALMHETNLSATHSGNAGGTIFRRYALWGGQL